MHPALPRVYRQWGIFSGRGILARNAAFIPESSCDVSSVYHAPGDENPDDENIRIPATENALRRLEMGAAGKHVIEQRDVSGRRFRQALVDAVVADEIPHAGPARARVGRLRAFVLQDQFTNVELLSSSELTERAQHPVVVFRIVSRP